MISWCTLQIFKTIILSFFKWLSDYKLSQIFEIGFPEHNFLNKILNWNFLKRISLTYEIHFGINFFK